MFAGVKTENCLVVKSCRQAFCIEGPFDQPYRVLVEEINLAKLRTGFTINI